MHDGFVNMVADDCGTVTAVICQMPDINSPATVAFGDMAVTPVLLTVLPVAIALPDNRVLECARAAKADFIVSGDDHLLKLRSYDGIPIVTTKIALEKIGANP